MIFKIHITVFTLHLNMLNCDSFIRNKKRLRIMATDSEDSSNDGVNDSISITSFSRHPSPPPLRVTPINPNVCLQVPPIQASSSHHPSMPHIQDSKY